MYYDMFNVCSVLLGAKMMERNLRLQALTLATLLPEDRQAAREVYALLGELIDGWIFKESETQSPGLPNSPAGGSLNFDMRCAGKDEQFPV